MVVNVQQIVYYMVMLYLRGEMYIGHGRVCVCLSLPRRIPTLLHGLGCNLGKGRGCPLAVHYWAVHGFRCYDNSAEREMSASACTCSMPGWDIIRPHCSTTYVDAACCYRPSSVVCRSVMIVRLSPAIRLNQSTCRLRCGHGWAQ